MLKCRQLVAISSDYLDAELGFRQRLAVRAHLAMCWKCRRFMRQLRLAQALLRRLPQPEGDDLNARASLLASMQRKSRD